MLGRRGVLICLPLIVGLSVLHILVISNAGNHSGSMLKPTTVEDIIPPAQAAVDSSGSTGVTDPTKSMSKPINPAQAAVDSSRSIGDTEMNHAAARKSISKETARSRPKDIVAPVRAAAALSSGSTGVRFSGDKVRVFEKRGNFSLLGIEGEGAAGNKKPILFPSPSDPKASDGDGDGGFGTACGQWAVVTTIHVPNPSIIGVADLQKWCLVIVGDTITPDSAYTDLAKRDNVFYLSASYQKDFLLTGTQSNKSQFIEMMPFKSFARKNIGYLFAINYGAQVIFDFDDDNVLKPLEDGETIPPPLVYFDNDGLGAGLNRTVLLKFIKNSEDQVNATNEVRPPLAFNPYIFMGASHNYSWPRGFPINELQKNFVNGKLDTTEVGDLAYSSIGVIQSLCNGDPDNDAVFRMTRPDSTNFTFERSATSLPLLIPSNAYTPFNAQATTHLYNAFWGLYLPITVPGRVTDIWRSYITQRIMKDVGLHVMYTPPIVHHERTSHDYLSDFVAESDLYGKTSKLLEFLDGWSSDANELPERILDLWVGLYEHDYLGLHDVEAAREWLNTLIMIGYKFPSIVNSGRESMALPQIQPSLDGQPYRSLPHYNVKGDNGTIQTELAQFRPDSAVVKLIMMTMNEWPLLKSWVLYHGHLLGFENLYILDSSTNTRCISFLRYARDSLGVNVIFSDANLNELESIMTEIGQHIGGSSDLILKMDTDEFLTIHDNDNMTTSFSDYLSGFATNETHALRLDDNSRVGYIQFSMPSEEICQNEIHSKPDKFPLLPIEFMGDYRFKMVFESKKMVMGGSVINLGGHAVGMGENKHWTNFGVVHYRKRCVEIGVENDRQVLERHDYISPSDSDQEVKVKLARKFDCKPTKNMCKSCPFKKKFTSYHKVKAYLRWLDCPEKVKKEFYEGDVEKGLHNLRVSNAMHKSYERFDL